MAGKNCITASQIESGKYNLKISDSVIMEFDMEGRIAWELSFLTDLTDQEVCRLYNVDSRQDAIEGIEEYWRWIV